jgi:hypothetical protein
MTASAWITARARGNLDSYLVVSGAVVIWAAGVAAAATWVGDFPLHVATVRTLAADFVHPVDPMVGTGQGSPYYSPYTLTLAAAVRITGAAPATVLGLVGVVNIVLLLVAFRRLVACFSRSAAAATVSLAAMLLLWGPGSPGWSGFPDIRSLAETTPYPSTIGLALMLFLWERLLRYPTAASIATAATIGVLAAAIVLIHPFTALETAVGGAAIMVSVARGGPPHGWLLLVAAAAVAALLTMAWPYSSSGDLLAAGSALVEIHRPLRTALLDGGSLICVYGLVALPALALRLRQDRLDPLVLVFALGCAVVAVALASRQYQYLRVIPVMMLPLQVAFGIFVAERVPAPALARIAMAAAAALLVAAGLAVNRAPALGAASAVPLSWLPQSLARPLRTLPVGADPVDRVRDFAPAGATVLTDSPRADRRLYLIGYYSVNPAWPDPWIGDEATRADARDTLLDSATLPAERGVIARRYGARCVLTTRSPGVTQIDGYQRVASWPGGRLFCTSTGSAPA